MKKSFVLFFILFVSTSFNCFGEITASFIDSDIIIGEYTYDGLAITGSIVMDSTPVLSGSQSIDMSRYQLVFYEDGKIQAQKEDKVLHKFLDNFQWEDLDVYKQSEYTKFDSIEEIERGIEKIRKRENIVNVTFQNFEGMENAETQKNTLEKEDKMFILDVSFARFSKRIGVILKRIGLKIMILA